MWGYNEYNVISIIVWNLHWTIACIVKTMKIQSIVNQQPDETGLQYCRTCENIILYTPPPSKKSGYWKLNDIPIVNQTFCRLTYPYDSLFQEVGDFLMALWLPSSYQSWLAPYKCKYLDCGVKYHYSSPLSKNPYYRSTAATISVAIFTQCLVAFWTLSLSAFVLLSAHRMYSHPQIEISRSFLSIFWCEISVAVLGWDHFSQPLGHNHLHQLIDNIIIVLCENIKNWAL